MKRYYSKLYHITLKDIASKICELLETGNFNDEFLSFVRDSLYHQQGENIFLIILKRSLQNYYKKPWNKCFICTTYSLISLAHSYFNHKIVCKPSRKRKREFLRFTTKKFKLKPIQKNSIWCNFYFTFI